MSLPSVSVVILNWNGREYLDECLRSVQAQQYAGPFEIVLADNASSDGSTTLVRSAFPAVRIIESATNLGFGGGNNFAVDQLSSDTIAFLNNDTRVDPHWLSEMVTVLTSAPDVAAAGGKMLSWDGKQIDFLAGGATLTGFGLQLGWLENAERYGEEQDILAPCGGSMLIWRDRFLKVGGFDADYFLFYEDLDLGWRLWLAGWRVRSAPRSVAYHRHHGSVRHVADQRRAVLYERNALYTLYKNYDDAHLGAVLPAALILAAEKATLLANPDRAAFRIGSDLATTRGTAVTRAGLPPVKRLREDLRRRGLAGTVRRLPGAAARRISPVVSRVRRAAARRLSGQPALHGLPPTAMATLLAVEQFGEQLPALRAKRAAVQAMRRRADAEILPLFGLPLEPLAPIPGFADYHRHVMHALQLDEWVSR